MIQRLKVLYGKLRQFLTLPHYTIVEFYFDEPCWMIYDTYKQVYVTGSISHDMVKIKLRVKQLNEGVTDG